MKRIFTMLLCTMMLLTVSACETAGKTQSGKTWSGDPVVHNNFTDLGNYVIELPDYTDESVMQAGLSMANARYDHGDISKLGCTAMITTNSKGEVLAGRNMDVEISQYPAYVAKTTYGKYKTFSVTYVPGNGLSYEELKNTEAIDEDFINYIPFAATDVFNEKGLYVESNMRSAYSYMSNYGLHSAHGETTRDDGTPWSELRACTLSLPQLVGQNCSTVREALDFIQNSYDWYTIGMPNLPHYDGWNMCFVIGDASGEYGLIEMAQDEVNFIPYQYGQANYYITPKWGILDTSGSGYGRLNKVSQIIQGLETPDEAMDAMKPIMWRNETLWIGESMRADASANPNPYNQIIFQDDQGNEQLDWRSDYVNLWPVMDDGRLLLSYDVYDNARSSTVYDSMILKYFDDAIDCGTLVIDDDTILFEVSGAEYTLTELYEFYEEYEESADDPARQTELQPFFDAYQHLLDNQNSAWCHDDHNFEALKACAYEMLHTRYASDGSYDTNAMSKYEKLLAFYGYGVDKDESFLRDDGGIWTTSLNIGVNCAQKEMKIRFWENDEVIYKISW